MCEIAVVRGEAVMDDEEGVDLLIEKICKNLYSANPDGLGLAAIYPDEESGTFDYEVVKAETPDWGKLKEWLMEKDTPWRVVVHARLATAGGTGFPQTHPIYVADEDLDSQWVIHNGVVNRSRAERKKHVENGSEFNTGVDSEVIAHEHPDLPDDLEDFEKGDLLGRLNYLLLGEEKILLRNDGKYTVTEDLRMTCKPEWIEESGDVDKGFALITPDKEMETKTMSNSYSGLTGAKQGSGWGSGAKTRTYGYRGSYHSAYQDDDDEDDSRPEQDNTLDSYSDDDDNDDGNSVTSKEFGLIAKANFEQEMGDIHASLGTGDGYELTIGKVHYNGIPNVVVRVAEEATGEPVENATVSVYPKNYNYDYVDQGQHETNALGERVLTLPQKNERIYVQLLAVPGHIPDDDEYDPDEDDLEAEPDEQIDVNMEMVNNVEWWHPYVPGVQDTSGYTGYCSMHLKEFSGESCDDCLDDFSDEALFGTREMAEQELGRQSPRGVY